jgi:hypothetical protein
MATGQDIIDASLDHTGTDLTIAKRIEAGLRRELVEES